MTRLASKISVSEMQHLREADGLSNKEIATRLGCSVGTVYNWIGGNTKRKRSADLPTVHRIIPGPNHVAAETPTATQQTIQPTRQARPPLVKLKPSIEEQARKRREDEVKQLKPEREIVITKDRRVIDCAGQFHAYVLDMHDLTVTLDGGKTYSKDQIGLLIRELMRVHGML